jgi:hypothetical protein
VEEEKRDLGEKYERSHNLKPKREIERQRVGKESGIYRLENTFI